MVGQPSQSYKASHSVEINRARKLCSDALKTAELVKSQLLKIYQADAERARIQAEREGLGLLWFLLRFLMISFKKLQVVLLLDYFLEFSS